MLLRFVRVKPLPTVSAMLRALEPLQLLLERFAVIGIGDWLWRRLQTRRSPGTQRRRRQHLSTPSCHAVAAATPAINKP